ncbi:response regulator [Qipengyuania sp. DSG2-2]|uniref:response regulator n=1 Tax=Qipengyuania sp. DGS2-2 TaxID=3349631 RepID=UPI0036D35876
MARKQLKSPSPGHCMVVEDDSLLAATIEAVLIDAGALSVSLCASTAQAMAQLQKQLPDVLVLDVHLADSDDGWALAELVATIGPKRPRIIFSTGSPDDIPQSIRKLGTVLAKPYAPEELAALAMPAPQKGLLQRLRP